LAAHVCDLQPGEFVHTLGDTHLYLNHLDQARLQLARQPYPLPNLKLSSEVKDLFMFDYQDILLEGYQSHPSIKGEISV
jgi:thymidylate synthase